MPSGGRRVVGDTRLLHAPRESGIQRGGKRLIEIVVNGNVAAQQEVDADNKVHSLEFTVPIQMSSWVALRQFPQFTRIQSTSLWTTSLSERPRKVLVGAKKPFTCYGKTGSGSSLWKSNRLREAYDRAIAKYRMIAIEAS